MKQILRVLKVSRSGVLALVCLLLIADVARAASTEVVDVFPEHYALLRITGVAPDQPLDKEAISEMVFQAVRQTDVWHLKYLVYDKGKKPGDGVRAYGSRTYGEDKITFWEVTGPNAGALGKTIETLTGYLIPAEKLYNAYVKNEEAANKEYNGRQVLCRILDRPQAIQLNWDVSGAPYIKLPVDADGQYGLHITLGKDDPFLPKIINSSEIGLRITPKGLVKQWVMADGVVVRSENFILGADGKIESQSIIPK